MSNPLSHLTIIFFDLEVFVVISSVICFDTFPQWIKEKVCVKLPSKVI